MLDPKVVVKCPAELIRVVVTLLAGGHVLVRRVTLLVYIAFTNHVIPAGKSPLYILSEPVDGDESRTTLLFRNKDERFVAVSVPGSLTERHLYGELRLVLTMMPVFEEPEKDGGGGCRVDQ